MKKIVLLVVGLIVITGIPMTAIADLRDMRQQFFQKKNHTPYTEYWQNKKSKQIISISYLQFNKVMAFFKPDLGEYNESVKGITLMTTSSLDESDYKKISKEFQEEEVLKKNKPTILLRVGYGVTEDYFFTDTDRIHVDFENNVHSLISSIRLFVKKPAEENIWKWIKKEIKEKIKQYDMEK